MKKRLMLLAVLSALAIPVLIPALGQGKGRQSHGGKQNAPSHSGLVGTVTDLQATKSGSTFTLSEGRNHTVTVVTTATTTITNQSDGSAATLADGLHVGVKGTYDSTSNTVTATAITVAKSVFGTVGNLKVSNTGDTFDLTYAPSQTLSIVMTSATTVKNASDGSAATLSEGQQVMVTGAYDAKTETYAATAIVVNDRKPAAKWFGTVANLQTTSNGSSFTLQYGKGKTLSVDTTSTTKITNFSDNSAATLANGQRVFVSGAIDDTTKILTATSIVVDDKKAKCGNQFVSGTIASMDATAKTFVVTVTDANVQPTGTTVTVAVTAGTVYKTSAGKTAAFSDLTVGATVKADGTFDATTQTLTAAHIHIGK